MKRSVAGILAAMLLAVPASAEGARDRAEIVVPERYEQIYDTWHFAPAVKIDGRVYLSGNIATPINGDLKAGYRRAWQQIEAILTASGASLNDIVEMTTFHIALNDQLAVFMEVKDEFIHAPFPAWTAVGTTELANPEGATEIRITAHVAEVLPAGR